MSDSGYDGHRHLWYVSERGTNVTVFRCSYPGCKTTDIQSDESLKHFKYSSTRFKVFNSSELFVLRKALLAYDKETVSNEQTLLIDEVLTELENRIP